MGLESTSGPAIFISGLNENWPLGGDDRSTSDDHHRVIKTALKNSFPEISSTCSANAVEINLLSGYAGSALPAHNVAHEWTAQQYFSALSLSYSTTVSWDLSTGQTAELTVEGSFVLANPTNMQAGLTAILKITNGVSSTASISFGSVYKFAGGAAITLTKSLSAVDMISFYCDGDIMIGSPTTDIK